MRVNASKKYKWIAFKPLRSFIYKFDLLFDAFNLNWIYVWKVILIQSIINMTRLENNIDPIYFFAANYKAL